MKYFLPIIVVVLLATISTKSVAQISFDPATCTPMVIKASPDYTVPAGKMFVITYMQGHVVLESSGWSNSLTSQGNYDIQYMSAHIPVPSGYTINAWSGASVHGYLIDLGTYGVTSGDPDQDTSDCQEADSDNDGQVTVSDLLLLLGVFGEAC